MARKLSPGPRFSRYQPSSSFPASSTLPHTYGIDNQRTRWPQLVARRGMIVALVETVPRGYLVVWELRNAQESHVLDQRGPFSSRALAVCWARVGLLLREEAWLATHSQRHST